MRFRHGFPALCALLLVAALAAPAPAGWFDRDAIEGSGELETRTLDLPAFEALAVGGVFDVDVRFGDDPSVEVTIDDNLWDNLVAEVEDGTLTLDWDESCDPDDDCRVVIVTRKLERLEVHGACDARVHGLDGDRFAFRVHGAAELDIDGEVDELEITITGAGEVEARDLKARRVKARISGAGEAEVFASESIDARISGAGSLDYWGDPDARETSVSGVGSIRRR